MTQQQHRGLPENVILEAVLGSTAYGLAGPDSDIDKLGVFQEPTRNFLGLDGVPAKHESYVTTRPDRSLHELGKFCRKLLGGNPTYNELLWVPEGLYLTVEPVGGQLVRLRRHFLSAKAVRDSYFGYAKDQFRLLMQTGSFESDVRRRTAKHARHMGRLLHQGWHLYATGELVVRLDDPGLFRSFGDQVAAGDTDLAKTWLHRYEDKFNNTVTPLPEQPQRREIDGWLRAVRAEQL